MALNKSTHEWECEKKQNFKLNLSLIMVPQTHRKLEKKLCINYEHFPALWEYIFMKPSFTMVKKAWFLLENEQDTANIRQSRETNYNLYGEIHKKSSSR